MQVTISINMITFDRDLSDETFIALYLSHRSLEIATCRHYILAAIGDTIYLVH